MKEDHGFVSPARFLSAYLVSSCSSTCSLNKPLSHCELNAAWCVPKGWCADTTEMILHISAASIHALVAVCAVARSAVTYNYSP